MPLHLLLAGTAATEHCEGTVQYVAESNDHCGGNIPGKVLFQQRKPNEGYNKNRGRAGQESQVNSPVLLPRTAAGEEKSKQCDDGDDDLR